MDEMRTIEVSGWDRMAGAAHPAGEAPAEAHSAGVLIAIPCLNEADVLADVVGRILDDDGLDWRDW